MTGIHALFMRIHTPSTQQGSGARQVRLGQYFPHCPHVRGVAVMMPQTNQSSGPESLTVGGFDICCDLRCREVFRLLLVSVLVQVVGW